CRFRWRAGSLAMWDNRCTQHRVVADALPEYRRMERVTLLGDVPVA
ncbi:MAG TPA: TauD/TfdA family dioxygenase, partial [Myxococcota bacterium]|nr:TauD/TfdA family dioxygenase [Myxococcota bacterium]